MVLPEETMEEAVRMNVEYMELEFSNQTNRLDAYRGMDLPGWVNTTTLPAPAVLRDAMGISKHLQNNLHIVLCRLMAQKVMNRPLEEFEAYLDTI